MGKSEHKKQKDKMKKRRKEQARLKAAKAAPKPFSKLSLRQKVLKARSLPIHECLINSDYQEKGHASVFISRRQPDDAYIVAGCMVDLFCLGVKHALVKADMDMASYQRVRARFMEQEPLVPCDPALASEVVFGGVKYALALGFSPMDADFENSQRVFEEWEESEHTGKVEFGKNGRPFYIAGPYDNVDLILRNLRQRCGDDVGYFYPADGMDPDARIRAYGRDDAEYEDEDDYEDENEYEDEDDYEDENEYEDEDEEERDRD